MKQQPRQVYESPRAWLRWYYERNRTSFATKPSAELPDWSKPGMLVGRVVLRPISDALAARAADDDELAKGILQRGAALLAQAKTHFESDFDRDPINRDRVELVLAAHLGHTLAPEFFPSPPPVPFDVFPRYLAGEGAEPEEEAATRILWALFAVLERSDAEYEKARDLKIRTHPDLRAEAALVPRLGELSANAEHPGWRDYEAILARWLNPTLETGSDAYLFRDDFAGLLSLLWCRDHLRSLDREALLRTYYGETLSIAVSVG